MRYWMFFEIRPVQTTRSLVRNRTIRLEATAMVLMTLHFYRQNDQRKRHQVRQPTQFCKSEQDVCAPPFGRRRLGARPFGCRTFGRRPSCERKFDYIDTIIISSFALKLNVTCPLMNSILFSWKEKLE